MIYQMPENMGFPLPRTVSEMLPDQPLVMPDGTRGRYKHISQANLKTYTCLTCGKIFDAGPEYKYATNDGKCCSYHCFRPFEIAAQEKFRSLTLNGPYSKGTEICTLSQARARVKHCEDRLRELSRQRHEAAVWEALPDVKRKTLTKMISRWKQKLDDALMTLKEIEADETA